MELSQDSVNFQEIYKYYSGLVNNDVAEYEIGLSKLTLPVVPKSVILALCRNVNYYFTRESMVLNINSDCIVVGDLHGHILDLFRILKKFGRPPNRSYLFLGDIVDRGEFSLETTILIFILKVLWPHNIFLIRGNHEFADLCNSCGFFSEIKTVYDDGAVENAFIGAFANIPLGALVFNKILCLHGGIGPSFHKIEELMDVQRPIFNYQSEPVESSVWSDPTTSTDMFSASSRGSGHLFGPEALRQFLNLNNIDLLVRGHECVQTGVQIQFGGRLITVFSASNYCGMIPNQSGVLCISNNGLQRDSVLFPPLKYLKRKNAMFFTSDKDNVFCIKKRSESFSQNNKSLPSICMNKISAANSLGQLGHHITRNSKSGYHSLSAPELPITPQGSLIIPTEQKIKVKERPLPKPIRNEPGEKPASNRIKR